MKTQKEKQQEITAAKYAGIIKRISIAETKSELRTVLRQLVDKVPTSAANLLRNVLFRKLYDFVMAETGFLNDDFNLGTRCWYALHDKHEIIRCHNCGNEIHKNIKSNNRQKIFWCGAKCQGEDRYLSRKISKVKLRNDKYSGKSADRLPDECHICYHDVLIEYDDNMNVRLLDYYKKHNKTFSYWIEQDPELKKYLMEKSYPLDYTCLKVETRVKWVLDRMQQIPVCMECGRQIDFTDVKVSHSWPEYCCIECKRKHQHVVGCDWHAEQIYQRIIDSKWTQPLFSLEDFKKADRKCAEFKVKCLKCGGEFNLKFDLNFYVRNNRYSYFRCPECFPFIGKRQKSAEEIELFKYVKNTLHIRNVRRGDRVTIYPFELDIHPMKEHSDIAIEYNGIFWHSLEGGKTKDHVLNKVKMCEELGIKLVIIWENDFLGDKLKYFNFIDDLFNNQQKIISDITLNNTIDTFSVERMTFNKCWQFPGYKLVGETPVEEIIRRNSSKGRNWTTPTAGKLIYTKI